MPVSPRVVTIQIGVACEVPAADGPLRTAFRKTRVAGSVRIGRERIEGDEQVATSVHGGPERVVLAYPAAHYVHWREEHPERLFPFGAFAENFTVDGLDEGSVCIGDRYAVGTSILEVSVPRTPCGMISRASGLEGLYERVQATGRTGWLHRVLEPGTAAEGDEIVSLARPHPEWTVARAADVMARMRGGERAMVDDALSLADMPALATRWRGKLRERAEAALRVTNV